ncbi:hypothetical protein FACS189435_0620 [Bacteroidia bacterium]|nr:hypothetical protein FACS189435_0620 [Bacteroidia bacterium]
MPGSVAFEGGSASRQYTVSGTYYLSATSKQNRCTATINNYNDRISLSVDANNSGNSRTATVTLKYGTQTVKTIIVTQAGMQASGDIYNLNNVSSS